MFERMLDKGSKPSFEELAERCGAMGESFRALNAGLSARGQTAREIRFPYGKGYGWCVTHRRGKRLVCDVFAETGAFTVMLRLSDKQFAAAYPSLAPYAREYVDRRYPCGDGGWIHYRVSETVQLADIERLLAIKCGGET